MQSFKDWNHFYVVQRAKSSDFKKKKGGKKAFLGLDEKCMNESKLVSYLKVHEMKTCTSGL